jgi:hypothetical protein
MAWQYSQMNQAATIPQEWNRHIDIDWQIWNIPLGAGKACDETAVVDLRGVQRRWANRAI